MPRDYPDGSASPITRTLRCARLCILALPNAPEQGIETQRQRNIYSKRGGVQMSDVMTFIINPEAAETDPEGRLASLGEWSEAIAGQKAAEEGIELTDKHWEVIHFLREHYKRNDVRSARALLDSVAEKFEAEGGR